MPTLSASSRRPAEYPIKRFVVDVLASNDGPLAVSDLIECGRWFGFRDGTVRVCLSRLVQSELLEVRNVEGRACYGFRPAAARFNQAVRDRVWFDRRRIWTGRWRLVLTRGDAARRDARERTAKDLRGFHLRPIATGVWARPANVSLDLRPLLDRFRSAGGRIESWVAKPDEDRRLVERVPALWQIGRLSERFSRQLERVEESRARLARVAHQAALLESLRLGTETFRVVASDPLLPLELLPSDWPGERLRRAVVEYNHVACDLWADASFGRPARNPVPRNDAGPTRRARSAH